MRMHEIYESYEDPQLPSNYVNVCENIYIPFKIKFKVLNDITNILEEKYKINLKTIDLNLSDVEYENKNSINLQYPEEPLISPYKYCYFEIIADENYLGIKGFDFPAEYGCFVKQSSLDSKPMFHTISVYQFGTKNKKAKRGRKEAIPYGDWIYDNFNLAVYPHPRSFIYNFQNPWFFYNGAEYCLNCIQLFLKIISLKKINITEKKCFKKHILKQQKNNKIPSFSYKTLDIPNFFKNHRQSISQFDKRKSPRWHLRRGHTRRLANGRVVNVSSAVIGNVENGIIMKDYQISDRGLHERHLYKY